MRRSLSRCLALWGIALLIAGKTAAAPPERPKKPASLDELVRQLKDADYGKRFNAAAELEALGREAEPAIPALIDALGDKGVFNTSNSDFVYWMAWRTLLTIGPPAIPALTDAVKNHKSNQVRDYAMFLLAEMGGDAHSAIPVLQAALRRDADRVPAALALWKIDPKEEWVVPAIAPRASRPLDVLRRCLRSNDPKIRIAALHALAEIGPAAGEVVPLLTRMIGDSEYDIRWNAVRALGPMKQKALPAVPALLKALRGGEAYVRFSAAESLVQIAPRDKDTALALADALKDTGAKVPQTAARALAAMGPNAEPVVPALIEALKNPAVSLEAAEALGEIGPGAKSAVPALIRRLRDKESKKNPVLRPTLVVALGRIGPEAREAIPALLDVIADDDIRPYWRESKQAPPLVCAALVRIGPATVPALREALKDARPAVRALAAQTLGHIGAASKSALPALAEMLKDDNGTVRVEAALARWRIDRTTETALPVLLKALSFLQVGEPEKSSRWEDRQKTGFRAGEALHAMGTDAKAALPKLILLLKKPERLSTFWVLYVLRGMGPTAKPAVPALAELLKGDQTHRAEVAWTLGRIGAGAEAAVPALVAVLNDADAVIRWASASALGRIGPAARPAVPALIRALRDRERSVRASAAFALGQIGVAEAAAPLAVLLRDDEAIVRWAAFTALEALGPAAKGAVPALARSVGDRRGYIPAGAKNEKRFWLRPKRDDVFEPWRWSVLDAVKDMAPALDAYLVNPPVTVSERAIRVLAALGPSAREAAPALLAARNDDRVLVRLAADAALKKIDPAALDKAQPAAKEMASLWADLASNDEATAYRALWTLVMASRPALPWLRERLRPIAPASPERIARLIGDLDDPKFAVRAKATKELETLGEQAQPALKTTLAGKPSLEVRRRVERLLQRLDEESPTPARVRTLRAIAVLEKIGTPDASALLQTLAGGAPGAAPTQAAKASLRRLIRNNLPTVPR